MQKILISFLSSNYNQNNFGLIKTARELNYYDKIFMYDENLLEIEFKKKNRNILKPDVRGFGYWIWKPQIILQTLKKMEKGDILQYTDAGCRLNSDGLKRLEEYFQYAKDSKTGILAFQSGINLNTTYRNIALPIYLERDWTKADVFKFLKVEYRQNIINTPQIGAGIIFIRKCEESENFIKLWLEIMQNNYNLIDDSTSKTQNIDGFIEHRHDQSIFSILCKLNEVECLSAYEYWMASKNKNKPDWNALQYYPIHARRDISLRYVYRINKILKRILQIFKRG